MPHYAAMSHGKDTGETLLRRPVKLWRDEVLECWVAYIGDRLGKSIKGLGATEEEAVRELREAAAEARPTKGRTRRAAKPETPRRGVAGLLGQLEALTGKAMADGLRAKMRAEAELF
jgi:hypothetical protein